MEEVEGRVVSGQRREEDTEIEVSLRPRVLAEYIGQVKIKKI